MNRGGFGALLGALALADIGARPFNTSGAQHGSFRGKPHSEARNHKRKMQKRDRLRNLKRRA